MLHCGKYSQAKQSIQWENGANADSHEPMQQNREIQFSVELTQNETFQISLINKIGQFCLNQL